MIGGFIITGNMPKKVIVRAIGPSLEEQGVNGALGDPVLELHGPDGSTIATDDNWKDDPDQAHPHSGEWDSTPTRSRIGYCRHATASWIHRNCKREK